MGLDATALAFKSLVSNTEKDGGTYRWVLEVPATLGAAKCWRPPRELLWHPDPSGNDLGCASRTWLPLPPVYHLHLRLVLHGPHSIDFASYPVSFQKISFLLQLARNSFCCLQPQILTNPVSLKLSQCGGVCVWVFAVSYAHGILLKRSIEGHLGGSMD